MSMSKIIRYTESNQNWQLPRARVPGVQRRQGGGCGIDLSGREREPYFVAARTGVHLHFRFSSMVAGTDQSF
jgi:hypothetical protein